MIVSKWFRVYHCKHIATYDWRLKQEIYHTFTKDNIGKHIFDQGNTSLLKKYVVGHLKFIFKTLPKNRVFMLADVRDTT